MNVPVHPYPKVQITGSARRQGQSVRIDSGWTWSWAGSSRQRKAPPPATTPAVENANSPPVSPRSAKPAPPADSPPRPLSGLKARLGPSSGATVLELTNGFDGGILRNVRFTVTGLRSDGAPVEQKVSWDEWVNGTVRTVELPVHPCTSFQVRGTASSAKAG